MSSPSSTMRPEVGSSTPVSRLISVVLPAPLGPISAWRAPRFRSQRHVVGGRDAAEALDQAVAREHGLVDHGAHAPRCANQVQGRISRSRPTSTSTTRNRPSQKVQYCGVIADSAVLHQLEDDGADHAAIEPAGAADDQHQHHVGRAVEVEHVERGEAGGLRQQRAGRARHAGGHGVDHRPAASRPECRWPSRAAGCRGSPSA